MKTKHCIVAVTALAMAWSGTLMAASKFYKWVDDNGVTHYTQSAPPEGTSGEEVRTHNTASSDSEKEIESLKQERVQQLKSMAEQKKQQATAQEEKADDSDKSEFTKRCEQHRKNLEMLNSQSQIRVKDPKTGEPIPLSDDQRAKQIKETQDALKGCPPAS